LKNKIIIVLIFRHLNILERTKNKEKIIIKK